MTETIAVIGAGAFGTALSATIAMAGRNRAILVGRDAMKMADLAQAHVHKDALPGIRLPEALDFSADPASLSRAGIVLFAMPSQAQEEAAATYGPYLKDDAAVVCCAKGIERAGGRLLSDMLSEALPHHEIAVLSGPGFAADIARGLPTAMVLAAREAGLAERLAQAISGPSFRLYPSTDRIGVQLGGALKNVLAIACGIVEGKGIGESARAALISRGLAEMSRLVAALGGQAETVRGLSGLGDLVLTATSHQSRNLRYGIALGRGAHPTPLESGLVEGVFAAGVAVRLGDAHGIDLPITKAVSGIIEGQLSIAGAVEALMSRPITTE